MRFTNRTQAGKLLAELLKKYKDKEVVVYALPRGGIVTALEIAKYLHAPLDLIITRKIGNPQNLEYAIAATAENGHIVGSKKEIASIDKTWFEKEVKKQRLEAKHRREMYLAGREAIPARGKIAILVDDGIATGLTMQAGIKELKHKHPRKIVVAVPVIPKTTANVLRHQIDAVVALDTPSDTAFLGSVGAYYDEFPQLEDEQVIAILKDYEKERA